MNRAKQKSIIIGILLAEGVGLLSSLLAGNIREVYDSIRLPLLAPPGWLFPVAWIILYACMGTAAALVSHSRTVSAENKGRALVLYGTQLFVNFWWSIAFARFQAFFAALLILILLDVLVVLTIRAFGKADRLAVRLMIPYLAWILYATWLNLGVVILN